MKVKIGPYNIDVEYCDVRDPQGQEIYGHTVLAEQKMQIKKNMPKTVTNETILHESIHLIGDLIGLSIKERDVLALSHYLMMYIKDNKQLVSNFLD